jgi:hypothetical protein
VCESVSHSCTLKKLTLTRSLWNAKRKKKIKRATASKKTVHNDRAAAAEEEGTRGRVRERESNLEKCVFVYKKAVKSNIVDV